MKLDFTFEGKICSKYARLFNQIVVDIQHPFTELIKSRKMVKVNLPFLDLFPQFFNWIVIGRIGL